MRGSIQVFYVLAFVRVSNLEIHTSISVLFSKPFKSKTALICIITYLYEIVVSFSNPGVPKVVHYSGTPAPRFLCHSTIS